jgi:hypothetical protein
LTLREVADQEVPANNVRGSLSDLCVEQARGQPRKHRRRFGRQSEHGEPRDGEVSTIDRAAVAGSLDRLAEYLAAIRPGKLAIIAGDEISTSNAAAETVLLADALGAPVYGSSWPAHIPFPTAHPLWMGNLPTKATEIAQKLHSYDAIFALGGKSLITILYTEGSAVPAGMQIFQLSADARDLGRTYSTKLALVGDIRASLRAFLPLPTPKLADRREVHAALRKAAEREREARRMAVFPKLPICGSGPGTGNAILFSHQPSLARRGACTDGLQIAATFDGRPAALSSSSSCRRLIEQRRAHHLFDVAIAEVRAPAQLGRDALQKRPAPFNWQQVGGGRDDTKLTVRYRDHAAPLRDAG